MDKNRRESLARILGDSALRDAIDEVCSETPMEMDGSFEAMALRMAFVNGMLHSFNKLYDKAGLKRTATVLPRRLKPE
jgi:hypothetical protein